MSFSDQIIDFEALLYALDPKTEPLPKNVQHSLSEISQFLHEDRPDTVRQLRELIQQYSLLETAYKNAVDPVDAPPSPAYMISQLVNDAYTDPNNILLTNARITTENSSKQRSKLRERGDRIVALSSGGAFLGVLIAQIPGAIIGGLFAGIYAWFSNPNVKTDANN